jgi:pilus assembly protein CpaF
MQRGGLFLTDSGANPVAPLPVIVSGVTPLYGDQLAPGLARILKEVQRDLAGRGEVGAEEIRGAIKAAALRLGFELGAYERDEIWAHLERDRKPFGVLQSLVDDPSVSDIIVTNFARVDVQQGRRTGTTGVSFSSAEGYENFVERLLQRAGATYSTKKPIADGMIGSFARVHAVHKSLCESGPYLTIRLNRYATVALEDLITAALAPRPVFDYLRAVVRRGLTLLVVGEVGTGKTTLTRALAASIPTCDSILVIEDTPEIRLEHPHVRYIATREANAEGMGRVSPSECIRAGMRMAMNRIIFGEIRDAEAAEAFVDVCASGHPGLSTIHARSAGDAATRLELFLGRAQKGVGRNVLSEQIVTAVQVVVFVDVCRVTGKRRIFEVREIGPVADGVIRQREMFAYRCESGLPTWRVVSKVSAHREALEAGEDPVRLGLLPNVLDLGFTTAYRETVGQRPAAQEARW